MKQTLSIGQSAKLIERGVSENHATSSVWCPSENAYIYRVFTLGDLLSLLPISIYYEHKTYELAMRFIFEKWHVEYNYDNSDMLEIKQANELIDALYEMLLWCLDNNYVKLD